MRGRLGVTMLELIVVVAIMGVMAGVVGLAVAQPAPTAENTLEAAHAAIADARRAAIRSGSAVAIVVSVDAKEDGSAISSAIHSAQPVALHATAFPDGSVIADPALGIDRLTGRPQRAPRSGGGE